MGGTFKLFPDGNWAVYAANDGERTPETVPAVDLAELKALDPPPTSVRDAKERLSWSSDRATAAMRAFKQQVEK